MSVAFNKQDQWGNFTGRCGRNHHLCFGKQASTSWLQRKMKPLLWKLQILAVNYCRRLFARTFILVRYSWFFFIVKLYEGVGKKGNFIPFAGSKSILLVVVACLRSSWSKAQHHRHNRWPQAAAKTGMRASKYPSSQKIPSKFSKMEYFDFGQSNISYRAIRPGLTTNHIADFSLCVDVWLVKESCFWLSSVLRSRWWTPFFAFVNGWKVTVPFVNFQAPAEKTESTSVTLASSCFRLPPLLLAGVSWRVANQQQRWAKIAACGHTQEDPSDAGK